MKRILIMFFMLTLFLTSLASAEGKNNFVEAFSRHGNTYYVDNLSVGFYENKDYVSVDFIKVDASYHKAELSTLIFKIDNYSYKVSNQEYISNHAEAINLIRNKNIKWVNFGKDAEMDLLINYTLNTIRHGNKYDD